MVAATNESVDDHKVKLQAEIDALQAQKRVLEKQVNRLREPFLFASRISKLIRVLEKEEDEIAELARQVYLGDYIFDAQRWIGVLNRYEQHILDALGGKKVIDIANLTKVDAPENGL
jgi:hypothetical protein